MGGINKTHDSAARSWIGSANQRDCDFPIQNLPYGVFSTDGGAHRIGAAIGDRILDLTALEAVGVLTPAPGKPVFGSDTLNPLMALGPAAWTRTRARLFELLHVECRELQDRLDVETFFVPLADATMHLPIFVRSYTDFYASIEHSTNVGTMFRGPENALPPNWLHMPIGYNGRASSVVVSGTPVHRPWGQLKAADAEAPRFAPSERFDIELELGAIVGTPNQLGQPVTVAQAYDMIFGYVLLNDWSARDIQAWEYQPLGPFQAKATATTISPWVVTAEALEPFRISTPKRQKSLLPYLDEAAPNNFDIELEVALTPEGSAQTVISRTNYKNMYYSCAQQLAHHTSSGCAMCTGDLLGSGTISGPTEDSYGSLLELSWGGKKVIELDDGSTRSFIEDGDTLVLGGHCQGDGYRVGFGECAGKVLPAVDYPGLAS